MKLSDVIARFHIHADTTSDHQPHTSVRDSAILLPLIEEHGEAALLFCKRPAYLAHHPSQICFPGGKVEPSDKSKTHTAVRETQEELGIESQYINTIGQLNEHNTLTGFCIRPIVATLEKHAIWHTKSAEVDHAFTIKLSHLIDHNNWQTMHVEYAGKSRQMDGFLTPYGLLWGATASVVKNFVKLVE
ncbi:MULTISPECIES: NUDIX hydrolase [Pseudoalteromonas]|uniref:Nudix hydrolase domain-containing protein n=1 Tax=Pseudoalteromonas aurantia 208 TaxID=1314867 RepID=A0ABR9ECL0_9GAMM|nr:CoA pyrophosphatase [Pseudoalteromonas aurantia]MBE0368729.1 hypothetical protein [Pseudoalteromonas aurantia 208]MBQ4847973.1 CoA pyrophosphatase [Pseudoalteromonas sp. MMG005]